MLHLLFALAVFLILHLIPVLPGMRDRFVRMVGRTGYLAAHSILSTIALTWLIIATVRAPVILLWQPAGWQAWITLLLSPLALFLIIAGLISPNPLSVSLRPPTTSEPSGIVRVTRHPVFWGALIWAGSHIPPNGDLRSLLVFGSLMALAAGGFVLGDRRARRRLGTRWRQLAAASSTIPFHAIVRGRAQFKLDAPLLFALLITALATGWLLHGGHASLVGADPVLATTY